MYTCANKSEALQERAEGHTAEAYSVAVLCVPARVDCLAFIPGAGCRLATPKTAVLSAWASAPVETRAGLCEGLWRTLFSGVFVADLGLNCFPPHPHLTSEFFFPGQVLCHLAPGRHVSLHCPRTVSGAGGGNLLEPGPVHPMHSAGVLARRCGRLGVGVGNLGEMQSSVFLGSLGKLQAQNKEASA